MLRRWSWLIGLVVLAGGPIAARADLSIDVSPVRFELKGQAGGEYTDAVQVTNVAEDPVRLRSYVEDWDMTMEGTPRFLPIGGSRRSASNWIEASPSDFLLEPGQTEWVRFTIQVPSSLPDGAYYTALLLESMPLKEQRSPARQVFVRGRVAAMIYVTIGAPRRAAEIASMSMVTKEGKRFVRLEVRNTGDDVIRLAGQLECLAGQKTVAAPLELPDVPVLPGNRRRVDLEYPAVQWKSGDLARVAIDIPDVGRLVGDCPLNLTAARSNAKNSTRSLSTKPGAKGKPTAKTKVSKSSVSKKSPGATTKKPAAKSGAAIRPTRGSVPR